MKNKEYYTCNNTPKSCSTNNLGCLITVLSKCVSYDGGFLSNLGFGPGTNLTTALIKINDAIGSIIPNNYTFSNQGFLI